MNPIAFLALIVVTIFAGLGTAFAAVLVHEWGVRRYGWRH